MKTREEKVEHKWRDQLQRASEENQSNLGNLVPAGKVVDFLSVGYDKDKGVLPPTSGCWWRRVLVHPSQFVLTKLL